MILGNGGPSLYTAYGGRRLEVKEQPSRELVAWIDEWVERHPALCVAAALTLGVTLGWLIKRR